MQRLKTVDQIPAGDYRGSRDLSTVHQEPGTWLEIRPGENICVHLIFADGKKSDTFSLSL